jgi:hypothetical protein
MERAIMPDKPALVEEKAPDVAVPVTPAVGSISRPKKIAKKSSFDELVASIEEPDDTKPFSVKIPTWLRKTVIARIKDAQGKGIKLTQDMVAKNALMAYFDLEEPE